MAPALEFRVTCWKSIIATTGAGDFSAAIVVEDIISNMMQLAAYRKPRNPCVINLEPGSKIKSENFFLIEIFFNYRQRYIQSNRPEW